MFLPISFVVAIIFLTQGVVQNLHGFEVVQTLERNTQVIPGGPSASQEAIKILGTNGGGFWNVNSAHPLTSANGFTNLFQIYLLSVIGFSLTYTYGKLVGDKKQGYVLLAVMVTIWLIVAGLGTLFETNGNPKLDALGVNQSATLDPAGRELRGQGDPERHLRVDALRRRDDRYVHRRGELDARQLHAARRDDAAHRHEAR